MAAEDSRPSRAELDGLYGEARSRAGQHDLRRLEDPPIRRSGRGDGSFDMEIKLLLVGDWCECVHCGVCLRLGVGVRCGRRAW